MLFIKKVPLLLWLLSVSALATPILNTKLPVNDTGTIALNTRLALIFANNVDVNTGFIHLKKILDNSTVTRLDVTANRVTGSGTTVISLDLLGGGTLASNTGYYLQIDTGAFKDSTGNFAGITGNDWKFSTGTQSDNNAPVIASSAPANNSSQALLDGLLTLTFDEAVIPWAGKSIQLKRTRDDVVIETIASLSAQVTGNGTKTITINPSVLLERNQGYYLTIDAGAWRDNAGNEFAGVADKTTWTFTTVKPEISVLGNNVVIENNDTTPSLADFSDFGKVVIALAGESIPSLSRDFIVRNDGGLELVLGNAGVSITGDVSDFSITRQPAIGIAPTSQQTLTIKFIPTVLGTRTAIVTINSNDFDEPTTQFTIQGRGIPKDTQAPLFFADYPHITDIGLNYFQLAVKTEELAEVYFILLPKDAPTPTAEQISKGQDSFNSILLPHLRGQFSLKVHEEQSRKMIDLISGTAYQLLMVLRDVNDNLTLNADILKYDILTLGGVTKNEPVTPTTPVVVPVPDVPPPTGGTTGIFSTDIKSSVTNGLLSGTIAVTGTNIVLKHLTLEAGTRLSGGNNQIQGIITGKIKPNTSRALINNMLILNDSTLKNVTLGAGVVYPFDLSNLTLLSGVRFSDVKVIPEKVSLLANLGTKTDVINPANYPLRDFTTKLVNDSSILDLFNQSRRFKQVGLKLNQDFTQGAGTLTLLNGNKRYALRPIRLYRDRSALAKADTSCSFPVNIKDERWFELHSDDDLILTGYSALQAPQALQTLLEQYQFTGFVERNDGSLHILATNADTLFIRPALSAIQTELDIGLHGEIVQGLPVYSMVFADAQAVRWQQTLYASPADRDSLYQQADKIFYENRGQLDVSLNGQRYTGRLDYAVQTNPTPPTQINIWRIADKNNDKVDDYLLTYPNGYQQILFALALDNDTNNSLIDNQSLTDNITINNAIVAEQANITGGTYTGDISNHGQLQDIQFNGDSLQCGLLAGEINSQQGVIKNVQLQANTALNGGKISGFIRGTSATEVASLNNLSILPYTELYQLHINNNVHFPEQANTVTLDAGVQFTNLNDIPIGLDLLATVPRKLFANNTAVDLQYHLTASEKSLLEELNQISLLKDNNLRFIQDANEGLLQLDINQQRYNLLPIKLTRGTPRDALVINPDKTVLFSLPNGLQLKTTPALQNPLALQTVLKQLGFALPAKIETQAISLSMDNEFFALLRPSLISEVQNDNVATGLHITGTTALPQFSFTFSENTKKWQQKLYPTWADSTWLDTATDVSVNEEGDVSFTLNGTTHKGRLNLQIQTSHSDSVNLQVQMIDDYNNSGTSDKLLIYPNGYQQILFQ